MYISNINAVAIANLGRPRQKKFNAKVCERRIMRQNAVCRVLCEHCIPVQPEASIKDMKPRNQAAKLKIAAMAKRNFLVAWRREAAMSRIPK